MRKQKGQGRSGLDRFVNYVIVGAVSFIFLIGVLDVFGLNLRSLLREATASIAGDSNVQVPTQNSNRPQHTGSKAPSNPGHDVDPVP
jgi:hypothetical protein